MAKVMVLLVGLGAGPAEGLADSGAFSLEQPKTTSQAKQDKKTKIVLKRIDDLIFSPNLNNSLLIWLRERNNGKLILGFFSFLAHDH
jgi:hypothetical protein